MALWEILRWSIAKCSMWSECEYFCICEREKKRKTEPKAKTCQISNKIRNNMLQFVLSVCVWCLRQTFSQYARSSTSIIKRMNSSWGLQYSRVAWSDETWAKQENHLRCSNNLVFLHLWLREMAFWGWWRSAVIERLQWGGYKTGSSETHCRWTWEPERRD